ncbi:MAG TPA: hypothetical protein VEQ60_12490 [Longimicrobium sp.]|nr:hypothetical protein [Longimicrobium sp.]
MPDLSITARTALPEPLSYHTFFRADGRRGVAVGERTGRLWLLDLDPDARTCEANPLPIAVPRREDGRDWNVRHISGSHALDRLLLWSVGEPPRVYDLPSGQVVAELGRVPGRALCLSPDGRWVLCLGEGGGGMMDLVAPQPTWRETTAFHVLQREVAGRGRKSTWTTWTASSRCRAGRTRGPTRSSGSPRGATASCPRTW